MAKKEEEENEKEVEIAKRGEKKKQQRRKKTHSKLLYYVPLAQSTWQYLAITMSTDRNSCDVFQLIASCYTLDANVN